MKTCPHCKLPMKAPRLEQKLDGKIEDLFPVGCVVKTISTGKRWRYRITGHRVDLLEVTREPDGQVMTIKAVKCSRVCDCSGRMPKLRWKMLTRSAQPSILQTDHKTS